MTITTIVPNQLISNTGISVVGTASVLTALSDGSDTTYIVGITNNGNAKLNLGTFSISGVRVKQVRIRVRDAHDSAGGGLQVGYALLYDPTGVPGRAAFNPLSRGATNVAEQTGPWEFSAPGGLAFTQAVLNRMAIQVAVQGDTAWLRIHDLKVDVDTNSAPVTSSVTVAGFTTSTQPVVSWVYTDADGDLESRYRVKIFSSAQFSAVGFSPDFSASVFDSGDKFGDNTDFTVTANLINGTTYRAYVKTAQDWAGPEGQLWWSAWANSSSFTVAVSPPAAPSLTVTNEPTLPGYRNKIIVALAGLNLLDTDTASFENGTIGGWVAGTNTNAPTVSATNPKSGINDLLLTATAAGNIEALSGTFATSDRVRPGAVVSATASFRALVTGRTVQVGIRFFDITGATISTTMGTGATDTTAGYTTVTLANQAVPATAFSVIVRVLITAAALGEQHRVDEAGLLIGPSATWAQGGYNTGSVLVQRSQRISVNIGRTPARNWLHPQVASSGALTTGTDGFYPRQANDEVQSRILDRPFPGAGGSGAGMIEWTIRVGPFSYLDIGVPFGVATDGMHPYAFPAVPGMSYTFGLWAWTNSPGKTMRLGLTFTDAFNTDLGATVLSSTFTLTGTEQRCTVTATAPANTVYAMIQMEDTTGTAGFKFIITAPTFRPATEPDEYWGGQVWAFSWDTMRNTPYPLPINGDDTLTLYDHEVPPGRPIMYQAQVLGLAPDGTSVSSPPSIPVHTFMSPPTRNLLKDPFQPENAMIINMNPDWSEAQSVDAAIYHPLGRDTAVNGTADPIQVRDWLGGQDATFSVATLSELELYRLRNLVGANRPLLLQHFEGGQRYVLLVEDRTSSRVTAGGIFRVALKSITCARPI